MALVERSVATEDHSRSRNPQLKTVFLICADLDQSAQFYLTLGFRELLPGRRSRKFSLHPELPLELHLHEKLTEREKVEYGVDWDPGSRGLVLSFQHPDLDSQYAFWQNECPHRVLTPLRTTPWGTRMFLVCDPDGHQIEVQEPIDQC